MLSSRPNFGGDWHVVYKDYLEEKRSIPQIWDYTENFGKPVGPRANLGVLDFVQAQIYTKLGLGFEWTELFLWFIPFLIFSLWGSYQLSKRLFSDSLAAILSAFVYTINTYTLVILSEAGHINLLLGYSLFPILILSYFRLSVRKSLFSTLLLTLVFSLICLYDLRMAFIGFGIILILIAKDFFRLRTRSFAKLFCLLFLGIFCAFFLNLYIIYPIVFSGADALPEGYNSALWVTRLSFQDTANGLFLMHPFWGLDKISYFITNKIQLIFFAFPLVVLIGVILAKEYVYRRMVFLAILWTLGSFLISGSNSVIGEIYIFLFENVPGFSMFREPQKFYVLVMLPFSLLFGIGFVNIYRKLTELKFGSIYRFFALVFLIIFLVWSNIFAYAKSLNGVLTDSSIPEYSQKVNEYIETNPGFYRTLWVPNVTSSSYRSNLNPRLDGSHFLTTIFPEANKEKISYEYLLNNSIKSILESSSIRLVVFVFEDDLTKWYKEDFETLANDFGEMTGYSKIEGRDYVIFENPVIEDLIDVNGDPLLIQGSLTGYVNYLNKYPETFLVKSEEGSNDLFYDFRSLANISNSKNAENVDVGELTYGIRILNNDIYNVQTLDTKNKYYTITLFLDGTIRLESIDTNLVYNENRIVINEFKRYIGRVGISPTPHTTYLLKIGTQKLLFNYREMSEGVSKGPIFWQGEEGVKIYKNNPEVYVKENFDEGVLGEYTGNCNNVQGRTLEEAGIKGSRIEDTPTGNGSLLLSSEEDVGCYSRTFFTAEADSMIRLHLAYKSIQGELPSACIFDYSEDKCMISKVYNNADNVEWAISDTFMDIEGEKKMSLFLYSNANEVKTKNVYDEILVEGYTEVGEVKLDLEGELVIPDDIELFVVKGRQVFTFESEAFDLHKIPNASFENNVEFFSKVKDCNNKDKTSIEENGIYARQAKDGTDGTYSMELGGNRHMACYNVKLGELDSNYDYIVRFDYKSLSSSQPRFCLLNSTTGECIKDERIDPSVFWTEHIAYINNSSDDNYELYLYSYDSLDREDLFYKTFFDNIQIIKVPKGVEDNYYLISVEEEATKLPEVTYDTITSTQYKVTIKGASGPFFLSFNQDFNSNWEIQDRNQTSLKMEDYHFRGNLFNNSWLMRNSEDSEFLLVNNTQKDYERTLKISGVSLVGILFFCLSSIFFRNLKKFLRR